MIARQSCVLQQNAQGAPGCTAGMCTSPRGGGEGQWGGGSGLLKWQLGSLGKQACNITLIASKCTRVCHWLRGNNESVTNSGSRGCGAPAPRTHTPTSTDTSSSESKSKPSVITKGSQSAACIL